MNGIRGFAVLLACCFPSVALVADEPLPLQEWGTITGRIVFDGTPPAAPLLDITRDEEFCGPFKLTDESLVVDPQTRGIRYVSIWIDSREDVPIHPELLKLPKEAPLLDNRECRFEPRVLTLRTGQELKISNSDPVPHNAAVYARRNQPFSVVIPQNEPLVQSFRRPEALPLRVECSIHSWMRAWLLICDHPYAVVTDPNGRFKMQNVPAGEWMLHFWHERPGNLETITRDGQEQQLERGILKLTVPPGGMVDLGDVLAKADQFAEVD